MGVSKSFYCDFCESGNRIEQGEGLTFEFEHTMSARGKYCMLKVHIGMVDLPNAPKVMYMCQHCNGRVDEAKDEAEGHPEKTD